MVNLKVKAHVLISGRVQGVYFRLKTRNEAKKYDVTGWVRNLPDGRVEAVFEGEKDNVNRLITFSKIGPPGAKVSDLSVEWDEYEGKIRRI